VICLHLEWSFSGEFLAKHVITGLVWVYHLSVSSSVTLKHTLPASTSGFQHCNNTTPNPKNEVSADTFVSAQGLYNASAVTLAKTCLMLDL